MIFISNLISGIRLGSIYAIIALGYTMVYGIAKMLNFAHGDVIMIGAYSAFVALYRANLPLPIALIISIIICTLLGVIIERLAYKPLRQASSLAVLITAIGVSYFLQNLALLIWGSAAKIFPTILDYGSINLFNDKLKLSYQMLITITVCIVIMILLNLFIKKTKIGKAMRACSEDKEAAALMGINVDNIISLTFAIGSGLAAVAALLLCAAYPTVTPYGLSELTDAIAFGVLILVLLFKPTGLLGKKVKEKV